MQVVSHQRQVKVVQSLVPLAGEEDVQYLRPVLNGVAVLEAMRDMNQLEHGLGSRCPAR